MIILCFSDHQRLSVLGLRYSGTSEISRNHTMIILCFSDHQRLSWDLAAVALVRFTRNHRRRSEISGCDDERGSGVLCFSTFAHSATTQVSLGRLGFNLIPPLSLSSRYPPPLLTPSSPAVSSAPSVLNSEISRHKVNASFISYKIAQRWVAQPDCASNVFHVTPDNRDFLKVCDIILFVSSPNRRFRPDDGMH